LNCEYASSKPLVWPEKIQISEPVFQDAIPPAGNSLAQNQGQFLDHFRCSKRMPAISKLNLYDLELMINWCTSTSRTLAQNEACQLIWTSIVPKEAISYPFLMHGLLALSSRHLTLTAENNQNALYNELAATHSEIALALFTPLLQDVNESNCDAIFAFSIVITIFAFASSQSSISQLPQADRTLTPVDDLLHTFLLARGVHEILKIAWGWVQSGKMSPILRSGERYPLSPSDPFNQAINQLDCLNSSYSKNTYGGDGEAATEAYSIAIKELFVILDLTESEPKDVNASSSVLLWPVKVPERYCNLLRDCKPLALTILAHYGIVLHRSRQRWWVGEWSTQIINSIWNNIDYEWRPHIRWAAEQVKILGPGDGY
jgi:hypothetical protein